MTMAFTGTSQGNSSPERDPESAWSSFLVSVFFAVYLAKVIQIQLRAADNRWMTGDWLINYSAGFVRRGLIGEFSLWSHAVFGTDLIGFVLGVKVALYLVFVGFLALLVLRSRVGLLELVLWASPGLLAFDLYDSAGSGRKEIVLFCAFAAYLGAGIFPAGDADIPFTRRRDFRYLAIVLPLMTLIHEGLFFFFHFFLVYAILRKGKPTREDLKAFLVPYGASLILVAVLYGFFKGDAGTAAALCEGLVEKGVPATVCWGGVQSLGGFSYTVDDGFWKNYLPTAVLILAPLLCYAYTVFPVRRKRDALGLVLLALLPTVPLYLLAADWGRWMRATALLAFLSLFAAKRRSMVPWSLDAPLVRFFLLVTPLAYLFAWKLPHYLLAGSGTIWLRQDFSRLIESLFSF